MNSETSETFLSDCRNGRLTAVQDALQKTPALLYIRGEAGYIGLHWAAACGHASVV